MTSGAQVVTYPKHQAENDPQLQYMLEVLCLALSKSGKRYELKQSSTVMVQSGGIAELAANTGSVDVIWTMTNPEREELLLPIRTPVDRGLIGWRLALLNAQHAQLLEGLKLNKRTVIMLKNPTLPAATPLTRRELWFELDELRERSASLR